jgi:hypothetical protein
MVLVDGLTSRDAKRGLSLPCGSAEQRAAGADARVSDLGSRQPHAHGTVLICQLSRSQEQPPRMDRGGATAAGTSMDASWEQAGQRITVRAARCCFSELVLFVGGGLA